MKLQPKLKTLLVSTLLLFLFTGQVIAQESIEAKENEKDQKENFDYKTFEDDPLNTRLYTLDNGLKVYMTVFKDKPRIQTYIGVRAGSKNDPPETTGLAHYFEHMMFKGTSNFGTMNFEKEKPLIDKVADLFEVYRETEDEEEREKIYSKIDSISYEASKYAIPNEYDKIMSTLGADGTNAYTSLEQTVYINEIPQNQLENFFTVEADRFKNIVLRGFHTELETIYEEKNMTMTDDNRKVFTALLEGLYQNHTYGTQTTIGTQEDIKNPSMKNILQFHEQYYVPNNMAIALSGDFDPDEAIRIINDKFGDMEPGEVPPFEYEKEEPIEEPIKKEVYGPDAEQLMLGFRFKGAGTKEADLLTMMDMILTNGKAGLIDLNLNKKQKIIDANSNPMIMADYSTLMLSGKPKEGQDLDDVKELLLGQIEKIKNGEFDEWLMEAIVNDMKLRETQKYESNNQRAREYMNSFVLGVPWQQKLNKAKRLEAITKEDIVKFAKENFDDNYVAVYKRVGEDTSIKKIKKHRLTDIEMNRDAQSSFFEKIDSNEPDPIQPEFLNYKQEIQENKLDNGVKILHKNNDINNTFDLYYVFEMGRNQSRKLPIAVDYLEFLGSQKYTAEELSKEFYKLGASYSVNTGADQVYVHLSGLSETMEEAMNLFEHFLANAEPDKEALKEMIDDILKDRETAKQNPQNVFSHLVSFGMYGKDNPATNILSEKELKNLTGKELVDITHNLKDYEHKVLFYGNKPLEEVTNLIRENHNMGTDLKSVKKSDYVQKDNKKDVVYYVDFDTPQSMILMTNKSQKYNEELIPTIRLYNNYFGQGMKSLIFQEMREKRSLAYTALSMYQSPDKKNKHHSNLAFIATSYDKIDDAIGGLTKLQNDMPHEKGSFKLAKEGITKEMRTERITQSSVLFNYLSAQKLGRDYDIRKNIFKEVPQLTFDDIKSFQKKYISNKPKTIVILGRKDELDKKVMKKYGKVKEIKMKEIFGY
ncbi:MAG: M16 family metallopeptidase [Bacteroidales bacterium]